MKFFLQSSIFLKLAGFIWVLAGIIASVIVGFTKGVVVIVGILLVFLALMGIYSIIKGIITRKKGLDTDDSHKLNA